MTEAPSFTSEHAHTTKAKRRRHPNHTNLPPELIHPTPSESRKRGDASERRVGKLLTTRLGHIVESVTVHEPFSSEDANKHDLSIVLKNDSPSEIIYNYKTLDKKPVVINNESPVMVVYIQVKSRTKAITAYKQRIREKYIPESEGKSQEEKDELVKRWLTLHGIILINGSHEKSDDEIIYESFLPQLQRIQKDTKRRHITEKDGQMNLFSDPTPIQIFPSYVLDEPVNLLPAA